MAKIKPIKSLANLREFCYHGDHMIEHRKLAGIAARNLGGKDDSSVEDNLRWLNTNAAETSEEGVLDEVNFCLDMI